jgi:hypothetical protein
MTDQQPKSDSSNEQFKTFYEQINVAGNQLLEQVQKLIQEGNVRRVLIRDSNGKTLLEVPLTIGAVAGISLAYFALPLVAIGAIAAMVAKVNIVVERYENPEDAEKDRGTHPSVIEVKPVDVPPSGTPPTSSKS